MGSVDFTYIPEKASEIRQVRTHGASLASLCRRLDLFFTRVRVG